MFGLNTGKYGPEKTPSLDFSHAVTGNFPENYSKTEKYVYMILMQNVTKADYTLVFGKGGGEKIDEKTNWKIKYF